MLTTLLQRSPQAVTNAGQCRPLDHVLVTATLPLRQAHSAVCCSCSTTTSSSSSSCSSSSGAFTSAASAAATRQTRRGSVTTRAWFDQQQTQGLWDYSGSAVKQLSLRELELLHRLSFGHRNQRSYLVVLYKPDSPACQAFEAEVERLASGLRHEPAFVAAALDASSSEASTFVSNMLKVDSVPSVLLYPEAARGCLKFLGPDMSAVGMLAAINKARKTALPGSATTPGAAEWQLVEAATPLTVTALRAAAASGDREAVVAALQQQMQPIQPTPLAVQQASSYWTQGKVQMWGGLLLCSVLFLAWDLKLSDLWEDWCLTRRQAARQQGRKFTAQENLDDMVTYMMKGLTGQLPVQQQPREKSPLPEAQQQLLQAEAQSGPQLGPAVIASSQQVPEVMQQPGVQPSSSTDGQHQPQQQQEVYGNGVGSSSSSQLGEVVGSRQIEVLEEQRQPSIKTSP